MSQGSEGSTKAIFYALGANFGIAVAKFAAAWWTGSGLMAATSISAILLRRRSYSRGRSQEVALL